MSAPAGTPLRCPISRCASTPTCGLPAPRISQDGSMRKRFQREPHSGTCRFGHRSGGTPEIRVEGTRPALISPSVTSSRRLHLHRPDLHVGRLPELRRDFLPAGVPRQEFHGGQGHEAHDCTTGFGKGGLLPLASEDERGRAPPAGVRPLFTCYALKCAYIVRMKSEICHDSRTARTFDGDLGLCR